MSIGWVRLENTAPENLKVIAVSDKAFRLWINAMCFCSRARSSGRVPAAIVTTLSATATKRTVVELLDAGLFEQLDAQTYLVHDYLDYNPSRERIDEMRTATKERVAAHRRNSVTNGASNENVTPLQAGYSHARDRPDTYTDLRVVDLCKRLAARIRENDPKADPQPDSARWQTDMRLLLKDRDGDVAEVERVVDWCQADPFWHSNVLSPSKLRKQFTQLVLRAASGGRPGAVSDLDQRRLAAARRAIQNGGGAA